MQFFESKMKSETFHMVLYVLYFQNRPIVLRERTTIWKFRKKQADDTRRSLTLSGRTMLPMVGLTGHTRQSRASLTTLSDLTLRRCSSSATQCGRPREPPAKVRLTSGWPTRRCTQIEQSLPRSHPQKTVPNSSWSASRMCSQEPQPSAVTSNSCLPAAGERQLEDPLQVKASEPWSESDIRQ